MMELYHKPRQKRKELISFDGMDNAVFLFHASDIHFFLLCSGTRLAYYYEHRNE